jgi:putative flippase GtrA
MTLQILVFRYTAFAILAALANLATQRTVLRLGDGHHWVAAAACIGVLVSLVLKYFLDRRWIFGDTTRGVRANGRQFLLYAAMGLFTTAIFFLLEGSFWLVWRSHEMREIGAVLGLIVGYVTKYHLDKHFVFRPRSGWSGLAGSEQGQL